jgi:hypothetical protein
MVVPGGGGVLMSEVPLCRWVCAACTRCLRDLRASISAQRFVLPFFSPSSLLLSSLELSDSEVYGLNYEPSYDTHRT